MEFIALGLAAGIVIISIIARTDKRNQKRCTDAMIVLKLLGFKDNQISSELDSRGWSGGLADKADTLESIAGEAMHSRQIAGY